MTKAMALAVTERVGEPVEEHATRSSAHRFSLVKESGLAHTIDQYGSPS
ncbi:hypothetical protein [Streptomyces sp. NRRL F-4489]|nr:hypothetical protein [Streptomyces sp. NRRL F-4489]